MSYLLWSGDHRDLHSFPTRRSSDLSGKRAITAMPTASGSTRTRPGSSHAPPGRLAASRESLRSSTPKSIPANWIRSEEHTSELQSRLHLVCRLLLEKKKKQPKLAQH